MQRSKKTVVLGATDNPTRYAHMAAISLMRKGHEVILVGKHVGEVNGQKILNDEPFIEGVDTITLYVGIKNLTPLFDYIISLNPKRIIFNPGTENPDLIRLAREKGIETVIGCTLVMLSVGDY